MKLSFETKYLAKHRQPANEIWWHSSCFTLYIILLPFCMRNKSAFQMPPRADKLSGEKFFAFSAGKNLFHPTVLSWEAYSLKIYRISRWVRTWLVRHWPSKYILFDCNLRISAKGEIFYHFASRVSRMDTHETILFRSNEYFLELLARYVISRHCGIDIITTEYFFNWILLVRIDDICYEWRYNGDSDYLTLKFT